MESFLVDSLRFLIRILQIGAIWRRIQVPADYNFWDLHVAIQDSMGWDYGDDWMHKVKLEGSILILQC